METDTIIVVDQRRMDSYNNLWITPKGGGDEVKIGEKRAHLHPLFEQGKAVMLHWEVYMNKAYVADAKLVEGELPKPTEPTVLPEHETIIKEAVKAGNEAPTHKPMGVEIGKCENQVIQLYCHGKLVSVFGEEIAKDLMVRIRGGILSTLPDFSYNGDNLPKWVTKKKGEERNSVVAG